MKLAKKVWIIIAICFVIVGATISALALVKLEFDFTKLANEKYESHEHQIGEYFNSIDIEVNTSDIEFVRSQDTNCKVICIDTDKVQHNVSVVNNTLLISIQDNRKWYDYISVFSFGSMSLTVHLPAEQYDSLNIESDTGDINIPAFTFNRATIETDTGDIGFSANVSEVLDIGTDTGTIGFGNIKAKDIMLESDTGDITFNSTECGNIDIESDTGDIRFNSTVASEKIQVATNTGDVMLDYSDAKEISITTNTGDVSGRLLTEKVFICKSDTGDIDVPYSTTGGKCEITTDTGDIEIYTNK